MHFITVAIMFLGGVLGAASLIVSKKPDARELIDKLTPYQGWIGVIMFIWGVWDIIGSLRFLSIMPAMYWLIYFVAALTELFLGFLLGFGLISKYALSKNEQAMEKGQMIRQKLAGFQGILGIVAIILSILYLVSGFIW